MYKQNNSIYLLVCFIDTDIIYTACVALLSGAYIEI